jgi:CRP/FNR family transcriptional regulator, cyclic AMP receptor protein
MPSWERIGNDPGLEAQLRPPDDGVRGDAVGRGRTGAAAFGRSASFQCLLDLDADLADEVEPDARRVARAAATTLTFEVDAGQVGLGDLFAPDSGGPGLLLIDGVLALNVRVGDRISAELVGAGDLLQPVSSQADQLLRCDVGWRALVPVRFARLDGAFAKRVRFWPQLTHALLTRAGRRVINLDVQRAIAAQPRLEVRLALLLWHLAGRWGKVERGGIRLPLPLTHQLLGQLIAAERPSVSHALARLAHSGLVTGHGDEWHLHGSLEDQLPSVLAAPSGRAEQIVSAFAPFSPR